MRRPSAFPTWCRTPATTWIPGKRGSDGMPLPIAAVCALCLIPSVVLLETTAGCGTALGSNFEELAALRQMMGLISGTGWRTAPTPATSLRSGYDLVRDYEGVWQQWDAVLGLDLLRCLHLNDSKTPFASCPRSTRADLRKDRWARVRFAGS